MSIWRHGTSEMGHPTNGVMQSPAVYVLGAAMYKAWQHHSYEKEVGRGFGAIRVGGPTRTEICKENEK